VWSELVSCEQILKPALLSTLKLSGRVSSIALNRRIRDLLSVSCDASEYDDSDELDDDNSFDYYAREFDDTRPEGR
jgi:hypothetical protein